MNVKKFFIAYLSIVTPMLIALLAASTFSLYVKDANSGGSYGEVSLRSYFERGNGKKAYDPDDPDTNIGDYPYVITRPHHLYNLSRLQNLGVFSEQTYFQLGDVGLNDDNSGKPVCYSDDTSSTTLPYLDMSSSDYDYDPIFAIGSESMPFYGLFDGQNVEIRNLKVFADPQDAGLFGYTAQKSHVQNLYLNNVTINTLGYTSEYSGLYGENNAASKNVALHYVREVDPGEDVDISFTPDSSEDDNCDFDASDYFAWYRTKPLDPHTKPSVSHNALTISKDVNNISFNYSLLNSGGFFEINEDGASVLNLENVFSFFAKELEEQEEGDDSSIQASSTISFVASMTDSYGQSHSKVVMTLAFMFTLDKESSTITMDVGVGEDHGNNIGLIIGHCDGSADNCYAYNGRFVMNANNNPDPQAEVEAGYSPMRNNSTLGLIGLVGGSVHNIISEESDIEPSAGKDIGVLDLSTVYKKIIDDDSFEDSGVGAFGGVTYKPTDGSDYEEYLRYYGNPKTYVTNAQDVVSFAGQKLIKNDDLGIFTIATDGLTEGIGGDSNTNSLLSAITKEDVSISNPDYDIANAYYLYYATGEYRSDGGIPFSDYKSSFDSDYPTKFLLGHYLPTFREIESENEDEEIIYESDMTSLSFEQRELLQNYFFRFKLEPGYRANRGFYFSDVDVNTPGGAFLSRYFQYKLVDQFGNPIPAETRRSGVMIRDPSGREVRSFSASMRTFDSSQSNDYKKMLFCLDDPSVVDEEGNRLHPASNMVNFKIKTPSANVTIVASPADNSKPAAVGIYRLDDKTPVTGGGTSALHYNQHYEDPAYAFFMPREERLAYFDYKVDTSTRKGQIGVYDTLGEFKNAKVSTEATMPAAYSLDGSPSSEYGYETGKPRLFVHTFHLPEGEYCIGSATGESTSPLGVAKLYYVCAQGQDEGTYSLMGNVFASGDEVDNVDFLRRPRFSVKEDTSVTNASTFETALAARKVLYKSSDDTVNGTLTNVSEYDANVSHYFYISEDIFPTVEADNFDPENPAIENQRLYVAFSNADRSSFLNMYGDLEFQYVYDSDKEKWIFKIITNTNDAISHISINNYLKNHWQGSENTWVQLLNAAESQETPLVYTKPN